jgi:hypothetical protein
MISANSAANPSESIRSASSRIRMSREERENEGVFRRWSIRRPGVAITMSGRPRRVISCALTERPP